MSKGKFEPGKMVLIKKSINPRCQHLIGSIQVLGYLSKHYIGNWRFSPDAFSTKGVPVSFAEQDMILIDPDETPEQSIEAMRLLTSLPNKQEQTA